MTPSGSARRKTDGKGAQTETQHGEPAQEHGPVEGDPRRRVDLACRADRGQGRQRNGDADGEDRAQDNRTEWSKHGVRRHSGPIGSQGSQDLEVLTVCPESPANGLTGDEQSSECSDNAEYAEGDRFGLGRPFDLALDHGREVEAVGGVGRQRLDDLALHSGDGAAAAFEAQPVSRVEGAGAQLRRESRGHENTGREAIDIVVDDLAGEHDEADQLGGEAHRRLFRQRSEVRLVRLRQRVGTEGHGLTEVPSGKACRFRRRHHLIGALGIGHMTLDHCHTVLGDVHASFASDFLHVIVVECGCEGLPVWP
jgi:hypothetical protein